MATRANPYLLLGVDYGATGDTARRQFAKAARRLRRTAEIDISIEDLNWSLHEIENRPGDPFDRVEDYRVPADPSTFESDAPGMFQPPPVPLPRRSPSSPQQLAAIERAAVLELGDLLEAAARRLVRCDFGYWGLEAGST